MLNIPLYNSPDAIVRMRAVSLRSKGDRPCSRCLVTTDAIPQMGTPGDREIRTSQRRVDDDARKRIIKKARGLIYGKSNYAVDTDKVEVLLKPTSLTPAAVCTTSRQLITRLSH